MAKLGRAFSFAKDEAGALFTGTGVVIVTAGLGMYHLEHTAQPEVFGSVLDGLWWAVITLTTVGYGDVYPVTAGGRILATVAMFAGIGVLGAACGIMADALREAGTSEVRGLAACPPVNKSSQQPNNGNPDHERHAHHHHRRDPRRRIRRLARARHPTRSRRPASRGPRSWPPVTTTPKGPPTSRLPRSGDPGWPPRLAGRPRGRRGSDPHARAPGGRDPVTRPAFREALTAGWRRTGRRWRGSGKRAKPGGRRNRIGPGRSRSPEEEPTTPAQPEAARERAEPAAEERDVAPPPSAAEPEPAPGEEPPAPPDPEAVRDSVKAEVAALEPLHDELIEVLEAIHEALTDREEKRQAGQAVTMAGIAKRQDMRRMEGDAAAESGGRVRSARRSAGRAKARLEREIEEARATLARIRGEGAGGERMLAPQLVTV